MTPQRYSYGAILLHWLIAAALAFQIFLGWEMGGPDSAERFARFQLHKSIGITILVLTLIRLGIRFTVRRPPPVEGPAWARRLASWVHGGFYVILVAAPLTGWILVSTAKIKLPTLIFGTIPWPHLPVGRPWHEPAELVHELLAWVAIALLVLHVAGALRHQWLLGKPELQRMIPAARGRAVPAVIVVFLLLGAAAFAGSRYSPDLPRPVAPTTPAPLKAVPEPEPAPVIIPPEPAATAPEAAITPATWSVDRGGVLGFTASWNGDAIKGRFEKWRAAVLFDPQALETSSIRVTIDPASAVTGDGQRDDALKGEDFFAVAAHANAIFSSSRITSLGQDRYEARGTLDLKGVRKPVTLRFTVRITGDTAKVSGTGKIDRTDYGVGTGQWASTDAIAADVGIDFAFTAKRE